MFALFDPEPLQIEIIFGVTLLVISLIFIYFVVRYLHRWKLFTVVVIVALFVGGIFFIDRNRLEFRGVVHRVIHPGLVYKNISFTPESSLPDKKKIGLWNSDQIRIVKDRLNVLPSDNSYIDWIQFDGTVKNLNLTSNDEQNIQNLSTEAISDLFVGKDKSEENFMTKHFIVKSIQVQFVTNRNTTYKSVYTLSDGELRFVVNYNFVYDWFKSDGRFVILNANGDENTGLGTFGPALVVRWFDYKDGQYIKNFNPAIIPSLETVTLNNNPYNVFMKGFPNLLSKQAIEKIIKDNIFDADSNYGTYLQVQGFDKFYPLVNFTNYENQRNSICKGRNDDSIKFSSKKCQLNASTGEVKCTLHNSSCQIVIPL